MNSKKIEVQLASAIGHLRGIKYEKEQSVKLLSELID